MIDVLVTGGTVITMDAERRVLRGGSVSVDDGRIVGVHAAGEALPEAARVIDVRGDVIMPGLVDGHSHAGHCLTRGLGDGMDGDAWTSLMDAIYCHLSDERFWRAESRIAALERLMFGVTTSVSMPGSAPRVDDPAISLWASSGYDELGLRHFVAVGPPGPAWPRKTTWRGNGSAEPRLTSLADALRVTGEAIDALNGSANPRIRGLVGPSAIMPGPADSADAVAQVRGVRELADRLGVPVHSHAYRGQVAAAAQAEPEVLRPGTSLAHCAGLTLEELDLMAARGVTASHGPLTHAYAEARFPLIEAMERGVNVAISTDGTSPDRSFDLLGQARIAAQLQRVHFGDTMLLPAGRILAMITIDAARGIGMEREIGSLEPGKRADLIAIDGGAPHLAPDTQVAHRVVHHAGGHDVRLVMVDGEVLMEGREVAGVDRDAIVREGSGALRETLGRGGIDPDVEHPDFWFGLRYGQVT